MAFERSTMDRVRELVADIMEVPLTEVEPLSCPDTIPSWDSLHHLNLVLALEEAFGMQFSPEETIELLSVETIALLLDEKQHT